MDSGFRRNDSKTSGEGQSAKRSRRRVAAPAARPRKLVVSDKNLERIRASEDALGFQFAIPIEIILPAIVQKVRREGPAVLMQLLHGRLKRRLGQFHAGGAQQPSALFQITGRTRSDDILPCGPPAFGARDYVVKSQVGIGAAILAREFVAQKHIKAREGW